MRNNNNSQNRQIAGVNPFGKPDYFKVLEEKIDVNLQIEFYSEVSMLGKEEKLTKDEVLYNDRVLYDPESTNSLKKKSLVKLALSKRVNSYRIIEKFAKSKHSKSIRDWTLLAKNYSQMVIENSLSTKNTVFLSSGLGGKADKLRYFIAFIANNNKEFSEFQKTILKREFEYYLPDYSAKFESVEFYKKYAFVKCLSTVDPDVREVVNIILHKCNELGNFISDNYIVTNIKELTIKEIDHFLSKKRK